MEGSFPSWPGTGGHKLVPISVPNDSPAPVIAQGGPQVPYFTATFRREGGRLAEWGFWSAVCVWHQLRFGPQIIPW